MKRLKRDRPACTCFGEVLISKGKRPSQSLVSLRVLATDILAQVYHTKDTLEESVNTCLTRKSAQTFPEFDRSWIFEMTSGVLRYRGRIDFIIDTYALKKKPTGFLRRILQTAVFQLLAQDVEPALAVSEAVEAARVKEGEPSSKFANAILRKIADQRDDWRSWEVTPESDFNEQVAWCSLPEWLFKKLRKERGSAWVFDFSRSVLDRPQTWFRSDNQPQILAQGYQGNEAPGFVQDISNQKLVDEVILYLKSQPGRVRILDLCAAPGGKSMALAMAGYEVTATDISPERMQRVVENRSRLHYEDKIHLTDFASIWNSEERFDLIWIDAPCSSTGIVRRHPEIKWNRNLEDVEKLAVKQKELRAWAVSHLAPGGRIVYSTCSVLSDENTFDASLKVIQHFERFPQEEPAGDGICAFFLERA